MGKGFGRQNLAYGILSQRGIARKPGIINPLWRVLKQHCFYQPTGEECQNVYNTF